MLKNLEKINIIKRDKVIKGLRYIDDMNEKCGYPIIEKVIIFGSAVTDDCTEDSDIDLCFVTEYGCENPDYFDIYGKTEIIIDDLCDIFSYKKTQGSLRSEIDMGVTVYDYG